MYCLVIKLAKGNKV